MAYDGHRPILPGRNSKDAVHHWKDEVGEYSNYDLMNSSQLLDGAPEEDHVPGSGDFPGDIAMSRQFQGLDPDNELDESGLGPDTDYLGVQAWPDPVPSAVVVGDPGHEPRETDYSLYSNDFFDGVPSADATADAGHPSRAIDAEGTAASFGSFGPNSHKGVGSGVLADAGAVKPAADAEGVYGHEHVNEWNGVPGSKAL